MRIAAIGFAIAEEVGEDTHAQTLELKVWARAYYREWLAIAGPPQTDLLGLLKKLSERETNEIK